MTHQARSTAGGRLSRNLVVCIAAGAALTLAACTRTSSSPPPASSPVPTSVSSSAAGGASTSAATPSPAPVTPSPAPAPVGTASASSDSLRSTRCTAAHLAASLSPGDGGAAGSRLPYIVFTNTGTSSCTLQGWPGVSFVGNGNGTQLGAAAELDRSSTHATVTIAPGASAHAPLRIAAAENYPAQPCQPTVADGLRIYAPGETDSLFVATTEYSACLDPSIVLMSVQAIQPGA